MASKTIIVMSDSHGDRDIVQAIKDKYLGCLLYTSPSPRD